MAIIWIILGAGRLFSLVAPNRLRAIRVCTVVMAYAMTPVTVFAHSKTDEITLINGNTITGEIKSLLQGSLKLGTDSMGTVEVEWEDIVEVASDFHYEVRLQNGDRYYGSLSGTGEPGRVRIVEEEDEQTVAVLEVVELRPIEATVADRLDIRLGVGFSRQNAADVNTFQLTANVDYQDERGVTGLDGRSSRTDQDSGTVESNRYSISRTFWTRNPKLVRWVRGSYEDNDELNLDYRYTLGLGLGRALIDNNRQSLIGFLGFQGATEKDQTDLGIETEKLNSIEGVLGAQYALWRFDTPEVDLAANLTVYPGITEWGRWRSNADITLSWELVKDLYWDISGWTTYDNQSQSGADTDYGISTGISWSN